MNETEFINSLKQFCNNNNFEFKYKFHVGNSIAVVIFGKKCIEPFDKWLNNKTSSHTMPVSCDDGILSYVTL